MAARLTRWQAVFFLLPLARPPKPYLLRWASRNPMNLNWPGEAKPAPMMAKAVLPASRITVRMRPRLMRRWCIIKVTSNKCRRFIRRLRLMANAPMIWRERQAMMRQRSRWNHGRFISNPFAGLRQIRTMPDSMLLVAKAPIFGHWRATLGAILVRQRMSPRFGGFRSDNFMPIMRFHWIF